MISVGPEYGDTRVNSLQERAPYGETAQITQYIHLSYSQQLTKASIGPSGAENTIGSMVQYDDQVISLRLLRRNACKSLGLGLSRGRLIVLVEGAIRLDFTDFETGFRP